MAIGNGVIIGSGTPFPGAGELSVQTKIDIGGADGLGPFGTGAVLDVATSAAYTSVWERYSNDANGPDIAFLKTRAGAASGVTTAVDGDAVGTLGWYIADGADIGSITALIRSNVDGEVGTAGDTSDSPGRLTFATTPDGSDSPTTRMTIKSDGGVIIGSGTTRRCRPRPHRP